MQTTNDEIWAEQSDIISKICDSTKTKADLVSLFPKLFTIYRMNDDDPLENGLRYHVFMAFSFQQFRGDSYIMQANDHAEQARAFLLQLFATISTPRFSCAGDTHGELLNPIPVENKSQALLLLLLYYTLANVKLRMKKYKEALVNARYAELLLDELSTEARLNDSQSCSDSSRIALSQFDCSDVDSDLLDPNKGFYPNLEIIKCDLFIVYGKCAMSKKQWQVAEKHFVKALSCCESKNEERQKFRINVNHLLAKCSEFNQGRKKNEEMTNYCNTAYELAKAIFAENATEENKMLVLQCAHRLSIAHAKHQTKDSRDMSTRLLYDVLEWAGENPARESDDEASSETTNFASCTRDSSNDVAAEAGSPEYIATVCRIRSALISSLLDENKIEDAVKLIKQNLFVQQMTFGLYDKHAVRTQKLLLSATLALGEMRKAKRYAKLCLEMEEFTFGRSSKQAAKTREILTTLDSIN